MQKIGLIDFFLDEWHANHLPEWIRNACAAAGRDWDVAYAWAQTDPPGKLDTASWCSKFQVEKLNSIEEVVEKSDYLIVLSPDNPEHHEELCYLPLSSGKPVYVDKTFSPDLKTGVRLFELAEKHHTPVFSSSALRFASELADFPDARVNRNTLENVATSGPGIFANYSVHQFEMIVSLLGPQAKRLKSLSSNHGALLAVEFQGGQKASMLQMPQTPFQVSMQLKDGSGVFLPDCSDMFERLTQSMLDFFESGKPPVPQEETLAIMALIEAGHQALAAYDTWIQVEKP